MYNRGLNDSNSLFALRITGPGGGGIPGAEIVFELLRMLRVPPERGLHFELLIVSDDDCALQRYTFKELVIKTYFGIPGSTCFVVLGTQSIRSEHFLQS